MQKYEWLMMDDPKVMPGHIGRQALPQGRGIAACESEHMTPPRTTRRLSFGEHRSLAPVKTFVIAARIGPPWTRVLFAANPNQHE
jgi:hypothetical protein